MSVTFGPFVLDDGRRQLLRDGSAVRLSPKAYELLVALVALRPRAVSKADLQERLWPDTFVQEANLAILIGEIRAALGDDPREARYIRTVHRFGYAFCAEAGETPPSPRQVTAPRPPADAARAWCWILCDDRETGLAAGAHVIGRAAGAGLRVDHISASRSHARLVVSEASTTIEDLGSKNGTWVGTRRVEGPTVLQDGDEIRVGSVRMIYRARQGLEATRTVGPGE